MISDNDYQQFMVNLNFFRFHSEVVVYFEDKDNGQFVSASSALIFSSS